MFKKRDYNAVMEDQRHKAQKEKLRDSVSRSLKNVQQKEHVDGATIVSNEVSNMLCNVLEAVFLHGLKDNNKVMTKLVLYAQRSSSEVKLNFWHVAKRFTHKDVIDQLQKLSQINSDIGLCRAWLRQAINDGLMESYITSMISDRKALAALYHPWAYLLDYEHPEILRNYLCGLMSLNFHLSLNSSILNGWSTTTIALAGLVTENSSLSPVVRSATPTPPSSRRHSQSSVASIDSLTARADGVFTTTTTTTAITAFVSTSTTTTLTAPVTTTTAAPALSTPPNTPADPSFFQHAHNSEVLQKLTAGCLSSSLSSSSSGQASCPDPSEPHDPHELLSMSSSQNNSPRSHSPYYESMRYMSREDRKMEEQAKLKSILQHWDEKEWKREQEERAKEEQEREKRKKKKKKEEDAWKKEEEAQAKRQQALKDKRREEREQAKRQQALKDKQREEREQAKKMTKVEAQADAGKKEVESERQPAQPGVACDVASDAPEFEVLSEAGEGLVSNTRSIVDSIEDAVSTIVDKDKDRVDGAAQEADREGVGVTVEVERGGGEVEEEEEEVWPERGSSYGNSLSAMDGWTSHAPYHYHHSLQHQHQHHLQHQHRHAGFESNLDYEQSYETMLKGYHAAHGSNSGIGNVQDILDNLPGAQPVAGGEASERTPSEEFTPLDLSDDNIDLRDYEIISSAEENADKVKLKQMKSLCSFKGKNSQGNQCATTNCTGGVGFFHGPGQLCHFDGYTYCDQCHRSQLAYIPAEIIYNWNFKKKKVCTENYEFLLRMQGMPVIDIEEMSLGIYYTVPIMHTIMQLRLQLTSLRSYMFTCSQSTVQQLRDRMYTREHLCNTVHIYSVNDLLEVRSGKLEAFLKDTVEMGMKHVYNCMLCSAKGFHCELCRDPGMLFPFELNHTVICVTCKNVYHPRCKTDTIPCPKCVRRIQQGAQRQTDDVEDYACSPE